MPANSLKTIKVHVRNLAQKFDKHALFDALSMKGKTSQIKDAVLYEAHDGMVYIFEYGVVVIWDMEYDDELRLLDTIMPFASMILKNPKEDTIEFYQDNSVEKMHVKDDVVVAKEDTPLIRLALSHALAQSVKLEEFEEFVEETIAKTQHIPLALAKDGVVPLGRKEVSRERGKLFLTKSRIHLQYGLLDTPDFFWEYPELENYYLSLLRYFEVRQRIDVLNLKLETIQELLDMLADEQKHKHSSMLEWIIIILIAVEIVLFFWH